LEVVGLWSRAANFCLVGPAHPAVQRPGKPAVARRLATKTNREVSWPQKSRFATIQLRLPNGGYACTQNETISCTLNGRPLRALLYHKAVVLAALPGISHLEGTNFLVFPMRSLPLLGSLFGNGLIEPGRVAGKNISEARIRMSLPIRIYRQHVH
jgi:hypothetical protein